jgi:hypothetical protein
LEAPKAFIHITSVRLPVLSVGGRVVVREPDSESIINEATPKGDFFIGGDDRVFENGTVEVCIGWCRGGAHLPAAILFPGGVAKGKDAICHDEAEGGDKGIVGDFCKVVGIFMDVVCNFAESTCGWVVSIHCNGIGGEEAGTVACVMLQAQFGGQRSF